MYILINNKFLKEMNLFFLGDNVGVKEDYLSNAIHLTDLWKTKLSKENKEVVWKYFQVMIIIADKSKH